MKNHIKHLAHSDIRQMVAIFVIPGTIIVLRLFLTQGSEFEAHPRFPDV